MLLDCESQGDRGEPQSWVLNIENACPYLWRLYISGVLPRKVLPPKVFDFWKDYQNHVTSEFLLVGSCGMLQYMWC